MRGAGQERGLARVRVQHEDPNEELAAVPRQAHPPPQEAVVNKRRPNATIDASVQVRVLVCRLQQVPQRTLRRKALQMRQLREERRGSDQPMVAEKISYVNVAEGKLVMMSVPLR